MRAAFVALLLALLALALVLVFRPRAEPSIPDGPPAAAAQLPPDPGAALPANAGGAGAGAAVGRNEVERADPDGADASERAGEIRGSVIDPSGRPVEDATVAFFRRADTAAFSFVLDQAAPRDALVTTDREGRFRVRGLPAGRAWDLAAWHPEYCFVNGPAVSGLAGADQELPPIQLGDGFILAGVVVEAGGTPVAGAVVEMFLDGVPEPDDPAAQDPLGRRFRTQSGAAGEFQFTGLGSGSWAVRARFPGFGEAWNRPLVLLPNQDPPPLRLILGPEFPLAGIVVSTAGGAVADADLHLRGEPPGVGPEFHARSDADGRFAFSGVSEGRWTLTAQRGGYIPTRPVEFENEIREDIRLEMTPLGGVHGRVRAPDEARTRAARIELWLTMRGQPPYRPSDVTPVAVAADGAFHLELPGPGSYVLLARAPGCAPLWSPIFQTGPQDSDVGLLRLEPGATLRGRLLRAEDGTPVANALVSARAANWTPDLASQPFGAFLADATEAPPATTRTAADGSFTLTDLAPQTGAISCEAGSIATLVAAVQIAAGREQDLGELRASSSGVLIVRARSHDGAPLAGGTLLLQRDEAGLGLTTRLLDAQGVARVDALASGDWWVSAVEGGGIFGRTSQRQRLWLPPGGTKEIEIRLDPPR